MPLASSRSSTSSMDGSDRRRMSLPTTIDSSTKVTTRSQRALDRRRSSLQRSNSNNSINSNTSKHGSSKHDDSSSLTNTNKRSLDQIAISTPPRRSGNTKSTTVDNKENTAEASPGVTPYWKVAQERGDVVSPRLTRSATKNKNNNNNNNKRIKRPPLAVATTTASRQYQHEDYGPHGVVLNFSPPDQQANARREQEERERKLQERARRVKEAKERGRLLVFSPSNSATLSVSTTPPPIPHHQNQFFAHDMDKQGDDGEKISPTNSTVSAITSQSHNMPASSTSSIMEAAINQHHEQFACELKSLRKGMDQLLATREQAAAAVAAAVEEERRRADQLALEAQLVRSESLTSANLQLEDANKALQQRIHELQRGMDQAKELHVVERTRLQAEVQSTQRESSVRIQGLEESRQQLETQVDTLQQQKTTLARQVSDLETELKVSQEKLAHAKTLLETTRSSNHVEKQALQQEIERMTQENEKLRKDLEQATQTQDELKTKLSEAEDDLDKLQNQLLPESEEQLQEALVKLQEQSLAMARAEDQLRSYQSKITHLQQEVKALRDGMEKERTNFQQLNEDSAVAFEKMKKQAAVKDERIQELTQRVATLEKELEDERQAAKENHDKFTNWKQEMEKRTTELDHALSDTMSLLERSEEKEKQMSGQLKGAMSQLAVEVQAKQEALSSAQHNETQVSRLEEACRRLEAEAREQKRRAKELERQLEEVATERDSARQRVEHHGMREDELFRKLMENERLRRDLHNRVMQLSGNIRVFVRVRPPLPSELEYLQQQQLQLQQQQQQQQSMMSRQSTPSKRLSVSSVGGPRRKSSVASATSALDNGDDGLSLFHFPGIYDRDEDSKESSASTMSAVACHGTDDILKNLIEVTEPYKDRGGLSDRRKKWRFGFDHVFTPQQGQDDVWKATEPLVQSAIDGYNVTIFAFGQTGSGKTYTLLGDAGNQGLIARSIGRLFDAKQDIVSLSRGETQVEISVELLEIYNEQVRDLLAPNSGPNGLELSLKVTSNEVIGNECLPVESQGQVAQILNMAHKRRCVKATMSNAESSRSHMLFTIHFVVTTKEGMQRFGKLNICDLAGSERLSKSGANTFVGGDLLKETQHINKSLSTLSNVIERLQEGNPNVPYRESKLTYLLQNSLGGNSKTLAIVCCNPLSSHFHESLCSLRFASKVSKVDLKAVANFSC